MDGVRTFGIIEDAVKHICSACNVRQHSRMNLASTLIYSHCVIHLRFSPQERKPFRMWDNRELQIIPLISKPLRAKMEIQMEAGSHCITLQPTCSIKQ